jgi:DNA-binding LytR/AlgR family response regulator
VIREFFVKLDGRFQKIRFEDIQYVEAFKNYVRIITSKKIYVVLITLKQMEGVLSSNLFCRIHRSYIVSVSHITAFDQELVYLEGKELPLSTQYHPLLSSKVMIVISELRRKPNPSQLQLHSKKVPSATT